MATSLTNLSATFKVAVAVNIKKIIVTIKSTMVRMTCELKRPFIHAAHFTVLILNLSVFHFLIFSAISL